MGVPKMKAGPAQWHPTLPDAWECRRRLSLLQQRQREIVELMAMGWAAKEIARLLGIATKTVYVQINAAANVLDVRPPMPAMVALYHRSLLADDDVEFRRAS